MKEDHSMNDHERQNMRKLGELLIEASERTDKRLMVMYQGALFPFVDAPLHIGNLFHGFDDEGRLQFIDPPCTFPERLKDVARAFDKEWRFFAICEDGQLVISRSRIDLGDTPSGLGWVTVDRHCPRIHAKNAPTGRTASGSGTTWTGRLYNGRHTTG